MNMARYDLETEKRKLEEKFRHCRHKESQVSKESNPNTVKTKDAVNRKVDWVGKLKPKVPGWIIEEGSEKVVRVAPWVIKEQKKNLYCSLVGFSENQNSWTSADSTLAQAMLGKMPVNVLLLEDHVVWIQHRSEKEVHEVLKSAEGNSSPLPVLERWMDWLGSPPNPSWVRIKGLPLWA